jgi:predicted nucleotidyltransferase
MCDPCKVRRLGNAPNKPVPPKPGAVKAEPKPVVVDPVVGYGQRVRDRRASIDRMEKDNATGPELQSAWTERVKNIVQYLYDESWQGGKAPGPFAFAICGSGARKQTCPYSDLDSFIITETDDAGVLQRFDEASRKVKGYLEAINKADSTVEGKGFIFCNGGLNPLVEGRSVQKGDKPKLTTTPKEYAKHLESALSKIEPGRSFGHIEEGLLENAFAFGERKLYDAFLREVDLVTGKTCNTFASRSNITRSKAMGMRLMLDTTASYPPPDKNELSFNIKDQFMRMPQFAVKALTLYYNLHEVEPKSQIAALKKDKRLHERTAAMLQHLMEAPLRIRVRAHLQMKGENDNVCLAAYKGKDKDKRYVLTSQEELELKKCIDELVILRKMGRVFNDEKAKAWGSRKNPFKNAPDSIK